MVPDSPAAPRGPLSVSDVVGALLRHWMLILQVSAAVMALVLGGLIVCPRVYQSEAKLNVRVGRESIGLDPTATTAQTISVSDSREFEMNSVMDVIDSRAVLERVVDALGAEAILAGRMPAESPPPAAIATGEGPTPSERLLRDRAVRALADSIRTTAGRRSSVLTITARAASPELAQRILQTFLESFHAVHLDASRAKGSYEFFDAQCRLVCKDLQAATQELAAAKDRIGLISLEGRQKTLEDQVSALQAASVKNATTLAASEAAVASLKQSIATLPERLVTQEVSGLPDDAVGTTRRRIAELRLREQDLLVFLTPQHPQLKAIRQQIEAADEMLDASNLAQQSTKSPNPTRDQLIVRLLTEEATAASLRAEAESLHTQSDRLRTQLAALNGDDADVTRLQQRVDVLKTSLKGYTEKLEQSRIDQALSDQRISNVSVVQPATWMPKPVSPKKTIVLMLGMVVAGITGLGAAFAREWFRPVAGPPAPSGPAATEVPA